MNKKRMLKLANRIESSPRGFDMSRWLVVNGREQTHGEDVPEELNPCGTTCCIAGEAFLLAREEGEIDEDECIDDIAAEYLGLGCGDFLFYDDEWIGSWWEQFCDAPDEDAKRAVAVAYIRYLADSK